MFVRNIFPFFSPRRKPELTFLHCGLMACFEYIQMESNIWRDFRLRERTQQKCERKSDNTKMSIIYFVKSIDNWNERGFFFNSVLQLFWCPWHPSEGKEVVTKISKYANLFKLRHCKAFYLSSTCFQRAGGRFNLGSWRKFIEILSYPGLKCTAAQTVASLWRKCPKNGK